VSQHSGAALAWRSKSPRPSSKATQSLKQRDSLFSACTPPPTFCMDTIDTIEDELNMPTPYEERVEEKSPHAFDIPPATIDEELEAPPSRTSSHANRATWWPLPRDSIVEDRPSNDDGEHM
jgi:hypothetical protein